MKYLYILFCFLCGALSAQTVTYESLSREVFKALESRHFAKLNPLFDTSGIGKLVRDQSLQKLSGSEEENGKAKKILAYSEEKEGIKTKTATLIRFRKGPIRIHDEAAIMYIVFNDKKQIQQISFGDSVAQPFFQLQGYKGLAEVTDLYADFKTRDGLTLQGNVTFSDTTKKKLPLVVFVHGSGPNDRDETMGPNKFFRDLAQGLSQKGIAGFRYDKRTYAYQFNLRPRSDSLTLYEETINDALDAVKRAKLFSFVDSNHVYIVGHSQGAMCAPKIAELDSTIRAIVMMAAPARSIVDLLPEQIEYIAKLDDTVSTKEQMNITAVNWVVKKIKSPDLDPKTPSGVLLGASYLYWKSVLNYNQVSTAQKLSLPMYILNGERDYQVPISEFDMWKADMKDKPNVAYKSYPGLTHEFMVGGEGKPGPKDYEKPQHIPQYVVDDLAEFILSH